MRTILTCLFALTLAACGGSTEAQEPMAEQPEAPPVAAADGDRHPALLDPSKATEQAPETFDVKFDTSEGAFVVRFHREWSPNGADRIYNLVKIGFFEEARFFRAIEGFMVQFGISGDPQVSKAWRPANIPDDPVTQSNERGKVTFAKTGAPNSRSTQLFINYRDNANLDGMGFAPVGEVIEGMDIVDSLHTGYGEGAPRGRGPNQMQLQQQGNAYLIEEFPELDYIRQATLVEG